MRSTEELNHLKQLTHLVNIFLRDNPLTSANNKRNGSRDDLIRSDRNLFFLDTSNRQKEKNDRRIQIECFVLMTNFDLLDKPIEFGIVGLTSMSVLYVEKVIQARVKKRNVRFIYIVNISIIFLYVEKTLLQEINRRKTNS